MNTSPTDEQLLIKTEAEQIISSKDKKEQLEVFQLELNLFLKIAFLVGCFFFGLYYVNIGYFPKVDIQSLISVLYVISLSGVAFTAVLVLMNTMPSIMFFALDLNNARKIEWHQYNSTLIFIIVAIATLVSIIAINSTRDQSWHLIFVASAFAISLFIAIKAQSATNNIFKKKALFKIKIFIFAFFLAFFDWFACNFSALYILVDNEEIIKNQIFVYIYIAMQFIMLILLNASIEFKSFKPVPNISKKVQIIFLCIFILILSIGVPSIINKHFFEKVISAPIKIAKIGSYEANLTILDKNYTDAIGLNYEKNNRKTCLVKSSLGEEYFFACDKDGNYTDDWHIAKTKVDFQRK